jgi:hypothetical protein
VDTAWLARFRISIAAMRYLALAVAACQAGAAPVVAHYRDADGQPITRFEPAWQHLAELYGAALPRSIEIDRITGPVSRFDPNRDAVLIADGSLGYQPEIRVVAHETSHVALAAATGGASTEDQLRFFDEGLATVLAHEIDGTLDAYRVTAAAIARGRGFATLDQLAHWSVFFGHGDDHPDWQAYDVAADFVLFARDRVDLRALIADLAMTRSFAASCAHLGIDAEDLERRWHLH